MAYSSVIAAAFELASDQLSDRYPDVPISQDISQMILKAIMDHMIVGHDDAEALAGHAVSKVSDMFALGRK